MKNSIAVASIFIFFTSACHNVNQPATTTATSTTTTTISAPVVQLPNTPEDVIKSWESQIGANQFAAAKLISTGKALETVVSLDSTHQIEPIASSSTKILNIACRTEGDKSECDCLLEDAVGQLKCTYYLLRQNGQWYLKDATSEPVEMVNKKPERPIK